ncbi:MAG: HD-GYP domain-containing protein, partial [Acidimicrobiales bacterium]
MLTNRWRSRPVLSTLLSGAAIAVPLAGSILVAIVVGRVLHRGAAVTEEVAWWSVVLGSSTVAFIGLERLCRRLLPLAALLKMTMLFPDRAPKRFKVAWRAASVRNLERTSQLEGSKVPGDAAAEILALATSLSRHDRATRGHSERVRALTDMLSEELRLSEADRDRLRWSALLHDVGKLAVHPDTLNKSGELSEDEWEVIRHHPLEGRRLIAPLTGWLGEWSLAIEQHHESYDGSGYPFGLTGDQLSFGARIVSVADSFEVMTAVRSYKKPISTRAARQELTRCAGTQFDPVIVRAFLNISLGRLRWMMSPISWITDLPFVARLGVASHALAAASQVALGVSALSVGGFLAAHSAPSVPLSSTVASTSHRAASSRSTIGLVPPAHYAAAHSDPR